MSIRLIAAAGVALLLLSAGACATTETETAGPAAAPAPAPAPAPAAPSAEVLALGEGTFNTRCAGCHVRGPAPRPDVLATRSHAQVVEALTTGKMMAQGRNLTAEQKSAVASFLTGEVG